MEPDKVVRLLVVEESLNEAEALNSVLRNAGFAVRPAHAADLEALGEALERQPPDIVLCAADLGEPSLEAVCQAIGAAGLRIPVVAIAEGYDEAKVVEALETGAADYVSRENPDHLALVVARELDNVAQRRAHARCEQAWRESEKRCAALLESSRDAIAYVHEGMHVYANPTYLDMFGFADLEELEGVPILDMVAPEDHERFKAFLRDFSRGEAEGDELELKGLKPDGSTFPARMTFAPASYEGEPCTQIVIHRQTSEAELEKKLKYLSKQDLLTGLYNRQYFLEELEQAVNAVLGGAGPMAVLYVEVDNFKAIKESVGIAGSDLVLADVATLIRQAVEEDDVPARFGDHAFVVLTHRRSAGEAQAVAERIRQMVEEHISDVGGQSVATTASVGIALVTERTPSAQEVLGQAELAAEVARTAGGNRVHLHNPIADEQAGRERDAYWQERLEAALAEGGEGLRLVFQPIVSLHGDAGEKYEALLRMVDEDKGGLVPPAQFLPSARRAGLMGRVDRWVVARAIDIAADRRRQGHETVLFVKLSGDTVADPEFLPWLAERLKRARVQGDSLVFEVAESEAVTRLKETKQLAKGLKELHCGFTLDHFGSGLNSFHLLKHLPADYLKIDGSFIHNLAGSQENQQVVKSIADMAQSMGRLTIAEYVEDANSLAILWQCGVNYIQGHFLQEPDEHLSFDFTAETVA